jgi:hypothetical protein
MKKLFTLFFLLLSFGGTLETKAQTFSDVPENNKYYEAVEFFAKTGVLDNTKGTFKPENSINRAEFTKIVLLSAYSEEKINTEAINQNFDDIQSGYWYKNYANFAKQNKILKGYEFTPGIFSFGGGRNITKGEAAKVVVNTLLKDELYDGYCGNPVWWCYFAATISSVNAEIGQDIQDNGLKNITRGEMIELMYEIKKYQKEVGEDISIDEEGYPFVTSVIIRNDFSLSVEYPKYTFWETPNGGKKQEVEQVLLNDSILYFKGLSEYSDKDIEKNKNKNSDFDKIKGITNAFIFKTVTNEEEMDTFIKNKYGEKCEYKGLKEDNIYADDYLLNNRYRVVFGAIDENETMDGIPACFINYGTYTWYYPSIKKAVSVDIGQGISFITKDENGKIDYSKSGNIISSFDIGEPPHISNTHGGMIYFDNFLSFEANEAPKGTRFSSAIDQDGAKIILMNEVSDIKRFENSKEGLPFYIEQIEKNKIPENCSASSDASLAEYKSFENICRELYTTGAAGSSYSEIKYFITLDDKYYLISTAFKNFVISQAMNGWTQEQEDKDQKEVDKFIEDLDSYIIKISKTIQ